MRRLLTTATVAVALTIPAVATLGFGGVAGAKTLPVPTAGSSVVCTSLKFNAKANTVSVSKCYTATGATSKTFKTLSASPAETLLMGGSLNWASGPGTITTSSLSTATPTGTCSSAKDTNAAYSGTIDGAPNAPTGTGDPVKAGDVVYVDVCITSKLKVKFAEGTYGEF